MVVGISAIILNCLCAIGALAGPVAIGLAIGARRQIRAANGARAGGGLAITGLVTGIVATVIGLLYVAYIVVTLVMDASNTN